MGDRLLPAELAGRLLGRKLPAASRGQGQIRSRRPLLPPPRRRQRRLERGRIYTVELTIAEEPGLLEIGGSGSRPLSASTYLTAARTAARYPRASVPRRSGGRGCIGRRRAS